MVKQYCKLTGVDLSADGATNGFKSMCLNCKSCKLDKCQESTSDIRYVCNNENVMESGRQKILAAIPDGFEIETLTLKPMALKDPTKKCKNHEFDLDTVVDYIKYYFNVDRKEDGENSKTENASV